ncbi:MAG: PspC domain-containing protein [Bacteroidetes bacterium]|nr:PspC domain-containing protein [Bacteroidota bacterium]
MKKIININFHSRVIPIEESAYEILQQYINSLRRYFANEEGRDEIISDIENRFAELFSETLKKGAACITDADVNSIIASMGRPEEFEGEEAPQANAAASSAPGAQGQQGSATGASQPNWQYADEGSRRLFRAENDKILGGVCAGLANYLRLDPAIVRIIFVLITFGWGAGFLLYIILWIVLPTRSLPTNVRKRLYRNHDDKVIGGVASGLAAYFHIEVWIPRLIFSLPLILGILTSVLKHTWFYWGGPVFFTGGFGGTLFVTYIVLWIVLPEAVTASEKLEMRGEKVDLESIKNTIKSDLETFKGRAKEMGSEVQERVQQMGQQARQATQSFAAEAGPAVRKSGTGVGHALGVMFKAFFLFIAGVIAFALITALASLAFRGDSIIHIKAYVLEGFWQNFLAWTSFFCFLVIPVVALLTWLIRRITGVRSRNHYLGYTFATLWVIGLFSTIVLAGMVLNNFRARQHVEESVSLIQPSHDKLIIRAQESMNRYNDTDWWFDIDMPRHRAIYTVGDDSLMLTTARVRVLKSEDSAFHVQLVKISRGSNAAKARESAGKIDFAVRQTDSALQLPEGFAISGNDKFRNQQVLIEVSVPVGKRILVSSSVKNNYHWFNINPGNRRVNWGRRHGNDDWSDWDDDFDNSDSYSWMSGVEYVMTPTGLSRTDKKSMKENHDRKRRDNDDDDDDDDDDNSSNRKPAETKPGANDGYRYKAPEKAAPKAPAPAAPDTTGGKKTAVVTKEEEARFQPYSILALLTT